MPRNNRLETHEVMALAMVGMTTVQIRKTSIRDFNRYYRENPVLKTYLEQAIDIIERQIELNIYSMGVQDEDFPKELIKIGNECPPVIHMRGFIFALDEPDRVTIIGDCSANQEGLENAFYLGKEYAYDRKVIVSGLNLGCDTYAHVGCLNRRGYTIAVVGTGLDTIYPNESINLQKQIIEDGGLILSEFPIGVKATPLTLIQRTRLQAALSDTVILVQSPAESESLHTLNYARKYHKKCYAVAYPVRTELNAGNFNSIENGVAQPIYMT